MAKFRASCKGCGEEGLNVSVFGGTSDVCIICGTSQKLYQKQLDEKPVANDEDSSVGWELRACLAIVYAATIGIFTEADISIALVFGGLAFVFPIVFLGLIALVVLGFGVEFLFFS